MEIRKIKANLVSIHVDQLVDQGYLSRIDVPGDRRKVKLILNEIHHKELYIVDDKQVLIFLQNQYSYYHFLHF